MEFLIDSYLAQNQIVIIITGKIKFNQMNIWK